MAYRSALLGCGPRSADHIAAYDDIDSMTLVAACDMNPQRLKACGERFGITGLYQDLQAMLATEKPDVLHIVTPPRVREQPLQIAADHGVKAAIVEKPIALTVAQARSIRDIAERTGIKIVVNTQRRYYGAFRQIKAAIDSGELGEIRFLRMVTRGNILSWGPHVLDLVLFLLDDVAPTRVWATAYGMNGYDYGHPAPASMLIALSFPRDVMVYIEAADDAVGVPDEDSFWFNAELDIWCTAGRAWWTASRGWGCQAGDAPARVKTTGMDFEEGPGQREFTRAVGQWVQDDAHVHGCCLDSALLGFDITMASYQSAIVRKRLDFPTTVPDDVGERLEQRLLENEQITPAEG